jgi:cAMP-dependent protein kinase regulator
LLTNVMQAHFLFAALHADNLAELVGAMEKQEHSAGQSVVTQGESGEHFYVVSAGSLEIVVDGKAATVGGKSHLSPGQSFGELALIHNGPRAATLRVPHDGGGSGSSSSEGAAAAAVVVVYALSRTAFRRIVARQQAAKITDVKDTLKKIALFEGLSDANLATLAASVKIKDFQPGTQVPSSVRARISAGGCGGQLTLTTD